MAPDAHPFLVVLFLPIAMLFLLFSHLCFLGILLTNSDMMYYLEYEQEVPVSPQ